MHVRDSNEPLRSGTSVFLSPGTPHRLESVGPGFLKVLGVFSPPGSPAAKADAQG